jgi:lysophospholipase L1-like esterase
MNPGIGLCFRAGVLCLGLLWLLGCSGTLTTARSSTLSVISIPASPHHTDYQEHQQGRLTEAEQMDRLPHMAMIGDSLSRDFYVSSFGSSVWRSKMHHGHNWFLDTDPSANSVYSLYERLAQETPLVAWQYSSVGGRVDSGRGLRSFLGIWYSLHLSQQTDLILRENRFPDLVLIWIGGNNLHWLRAVDPCRPEEIETGLQNMAANFRQDYTRQLGRLVERALDQKQRRAIIVFGLANLKNVFEARDAAEQLRKKNPQLYPYFDAVYQRYECMEPVYRGNMVKLALMYNEELRAMVGEFNRKLGGDSQVRLEYSDALTTLDFSDVESIHRMDAMHPSAKAHNVLAEAAFNALRPSLDFLGIVPLQKNTDSR